MAKEQKKFQACSNKWPYKKIQIYIDINIFGIIKKIILNNLLFHQYKILFNSNHINLKKKCHNVKRKNPLLLI